MIIYLYIKQCQHCGLRYFGKTINKDVEKYHGSGSHWKNHIAKYGRYNVKTLQIWEFNSVDDAKHFALDFSEKQNIVESKEWANLVPEDATDGNSKIVITDDIRKKFQNANRGKNNPQYGTFWINNGAENRKVRCVDEIPPGWKKGRYFDQEARKKFVSRSKVGKNNPAYNSTVRHWVNIDTGEKISLPTYDFCQEKMLNSKKIREVLQGKIDHFQGWKLDLI